MARNIASRTSHDRSVPQSDCEHAPPRLGLDSRILLKARGLCGKCVSTKLAQFTAISANFALVCNCLSTHGFAGCSFEPCAKRMGDRAVYCARLESVCAERHPGFESPPIRHASENTLFS